MTTVHRCDVCGEEYSDERKLSKIGYAVDGMEWDTWDVCDSHKEYTETGDAIDPNIVEDAFDAVEEVIEQYRNRED